MNKATAFFFVCAGLFGLALLLPRPAAAWPDIPNVNVPLCTADGSQGPNRSISDGAGGAIVVWQDGRNGNSDIYARRISSDGTPLWTSDGVALCIANDSQTNPTIVTDGASGAIVAWTDLRSGSWLVYAQHVLANGTVDTPNWSTNGVALCTATAINGVPEIASDGTGGAIVTWVASAGSDIYAQRISNTGVVQWGSNGVALCTATSSQNDPTVVSDGASGAIVTWSDHRFGYHDVYAQRVLAGGAVDPAWTVNGVALCSATGDQYRPTIVISGADGAIVTWYDERNGNWDIFAQRISTTGAVQWLTDGVALCAANDSQTNPRIVTDGAGGAIVAWDDDRSGHDILHVYAQRVSSVGEVQWTTNGVALSTAAGYVGNVGGGPVIVTDGASGAIVAWGDYRSGTNYDIYAQRVMAGGAVDPIWPVHGVAVCDLISGQARPSIVSDGVGGALVAWEDGRGTSSDIYAQRVWFDGRVPVLLSLVSANVTVDGVKLAWFMGGSGSGAATVYRSLGADAWARIGEVTPDGTGYLRYTDPIDATATRVGYRLGIVDAGVEGFYGEAWVDLPARGTALAFALEPVRPNPTQGGALTVRFTLPNAAPARVELVDVSGRRIAEREVGSLGAGQHSLDLGAGQRLAPGLYLVRLTQGANTSTTRVAVLNR